MLRDFRAVLLVLGLLLVLLGAAMLAPLTADLLTHNADWRAFAESAAITLFSGGAMAAACWGRVEGLSMRGAFLMTASAWVVLSAFAAAPFYYGGLQLSWADAVFEAVSGLTTTGSTVITGLDGMASGVLLWRAILQWIGGIGIIVMALAILPILRVGGMQLFRLESSDTSEKILPRASQIAAGLAAVYLILTLACGAAYMVTGMGVFDAAVHAMTTVSTGGFSTSDRSMGAFAGGGADLVCVLFMLLGSLPFVLYLLALRGSPARLFRDDQVQLFLLLVGGLTAALTVYLWIADIHHPATGVRLALFNVVSVVTTTGYATGDYTLWGPPAVCFFFLITFLGGCAGSTAGGIKTFRFHVGALALRSYFANVARPDQVSRPSYNGRPISDAEVFSVLGFFFLFLACFTVTSIALSATGLDFVTAVSGAATALANVGPGLGATIGPAGAFAALPDAAKWVLSAAMVVGRLEVITILVLLAPDFWR